MTVHLAASPLAVVLPLRHRILRPGLPPTAAEFDGDHAPGTLHFAATLDGKVVCCLSLHASAWLGEEAWQVRGMATDVGHRRRGIGRRLLDHAAAEAAALQPSWPMWCNARVSAIGFYTKANWTVESPEFEIEGVGPHVRMLRSLHS